MSYTADRIAAKAAKYREKYLRMPMTLSEIVGPSVPAMQAIEKMLAHGTTDGKGEVAIQGFFVTYARVLKLGEKELFDMEFPCKMLNKIYYGTPIKGDDLGKLAGLVADLTERCKRVRDRAVWSMAITDVELAAFYSNYHWPDVQHFAYQQGVPFE